MEAKTALMPISGLLFALLACATLSAQKERTLPQNCPLCKGNRERMEAAGIQSHGPFPFGAAETERARELVPTADIYWIESAHFRLGFGAGAIKVPAKQAKKVRAELERLRLVLPAVKPRSKVLSPWHRAHLYAQRFEDAYAQFLNIMHVTQSDFPTGKTPWVLGTPYWGEGQYLGQKDKYEVLLLSNGEQQLDYLTDQFGLQIRHSQKWNILDRGALTVVTNLTEDNLRNDAKLHGHLIFNLVHNFVDGFKTYAYETPYWIHEGLGHYFERRLDPRFNSFSRSEGSTPLERGASNWTSKLKSLIASGKAPRLAELMSLQAYAEFSLEDHYTSWSMISFLLETRPEAFANLNKEIHGRKTPDGYADGSNITGAFRKAFKETVGISYAAFDREWTEWAVAQDS